MIRLGLVLCIVASPALAATPDEIRACYAHGYKEAANNSRAIELAPMKWDPGFEGCDAMIKKYEQDQAQSAVDATRAAAASIAAAQAAAAAVAAK